jgi:uncharacterized membrane protein
MGSQSLAGSRIAALDVIRGAVMVLMAVDHVRVFFSNAQFDPTDLSSTTAALFLTRWVTHFCAPAFVFLAGTAAYLHGRKLGDPGRLSRFLLVRGAWLVLVEMTLVRLGWTFNLDYAHFMLAGVIWVIGWSMILLAGMVRWPAPAVAAIGLAIVFGHNALDGALPALETLGSGWILQVLYLGGGIEIGEGGPIFFVLYSLIPWVGVMAAGFAFGRIMVFDEPRRRRWCLRIGLAAVALFVVLRAANVYGDPQPWSVGTSPLFSVLSFLNTTKYPASLQFLLMTLGPMILIIPILERLRSGVLDMLATLGRVPFFYYVLHIPLIHGIAVAIALVSAPQALTWLTMNHPIMVPPPPAGWGYGPAGIWVIAAIVVALLFPLCGWFASVRRRRGEWWWSLF